MTKGDGMSEDLRTQIIEAIAGSGDDKYKQLLLLILKLESSVLMQLSDIQTRLNILPTDHKEDHEWVRTARSASSTAKSTMARLVFSLVEKVMLLAVGALLAKLWH